jgi:hypothetical protein
MHARNVRIALKPNCAREFTRILDEEIIPILREQDGFHGAISFVAPERNEAMAISFWGTRENAEAYNHFAYLDVLRLLSRVVEGMPSVKTFEIVNAIFHETLPPRYTATDFPSIGNGRVVTNTKASGNFL